MADVPRFAVDAFLRQAKELIGQGHRKFLPRDKNLALLAQYGLTHQQRLQILLEITSDDFCHCDEPPEGRRGLGYVFKRVVPHETSTIDVYIKLKIVPSEVHDWLICISFHEAEAPMRYMYR
ncbi:MAG TPA: hypothetical protein VNL35_10105 [Chloroflexota bacterium]|nr:hypothetical protein [Chloroflexota bacterium]